MLRKLLTVALPLILPFVAYAIYLALARHKARLAGAGQVPRWQEAPWTLILLAGVVLMSASLFTFGLLSGVEPGTKLAPPRLIDGEVVPSRPIEE